MSGWRGHEEMGYKLSHVLGGSCLRRRVVDVDICKVTGEVLLASFEVGQKIADFFCIKVSKLERAAIELVNTLFIWIGNRAFVGGEGHGWDEVGSGFE
jgi:hypothetical protein